MLLTNKYLPVGQRRQHPPPPSLFAACFARVPYRCPVRWNTWFIVDGKLQAGQGLVKAPL